MKFYRHIPNTVTILNMVSGILGIVFIYQQNVQAAVLCIFIAGVFDFLDGFLARLLKVGSETGKNLDSLADIVSFGILPFMILHFTLQNLSSPAPWVSGLIAWLVLAYPVCAAVRLAIFNSSNNQKEVFRGLPVPAAALLTTPAALFFLSSTESLFIHSLLLLLISLSGSLLMVSGIPFPAFKKKPGNPKTIWITGLLAVLSLLILLWAGIPGISVITGIYILTSILVMNSKDR